MAGVLNTESAGKQREESPNWGLKSKDGTWSAPIPHEREVLSTTPKHRVAIAVDRLKMDPIPGVHSLQMDFLDPDTEGILNEVLEKDGIADGKVDVVLSDMAANTTGNRIADTESSLEICTAVMEFVKRHMRSEQDADGSRGGTLLCVYITYFSLGPMPNSSYEELNTSNLLNYYIFVGRCSNPTFGQ